MALSVELRLQAKCYQWYWNKYRFTEWARMLIHVDNNSFNAIEGATKKALGVVRGASDYILIGYEAVYFLEFKTDTGVAREEQLEFAEEVTKRNHFFFVVRSFEQFQNLIYGIIEGW